MTDTAERTIATPTERASVHEVLKEKVAAARLGGSESSRAKISESGKLLVRERLSLLFDDEDYLEDGLLARFEDGLPGDAVVIAFATHETQQYVASLQALLADTSDPVQQLRLYVRNHLDSGERFHMGLGPQLYRVMPASSAEEIREHVVAVEQVLQGILGAGMEQGVFAIDDLRATMSLIHACLTPRNLPADAVEEFVLHAVSATVPGSA